MEPEIFIRMIDNNMSRILPEAALAFLTLPFSFMNCNISSYLYEDFFYRKQYECKTSVFFIQTIFDVFMMHKSEVLHNKARKKVQHGLTRIEAYDRLRNMKNHLVIFLFITSMMLRQTRMNESYT